MPTVTLTSTGVQKIAGLYGNGNGATYVTTVTAGTATVKKFDVRRRPIRGGSANVVGSAGNTQTVTYTEPARFDFEMEVWADISVAGTVVVTQTKSGETDEINMSDLGQSVASKTASASQTQLGATALAWGYNLCTGNIADTLILPAATGSGRHVQVFSSTPYFLTVYPAVGEQISSFGANAGYAVIANQLVEFVDQGSAQWQIFSNLPIMYPIYFLTARAGGGQASATQAGYATNVVTVCATNADSIKLPIAIGGLQQLFVSNYGAASLRIYPTTGTYLNNVLNGSYDLAANKTAMFLDTGPNPHNMWSGGALA